jgi:hypothetical protein
MPAEWKKTSVHFFLKIYIDIVKKIYERVKGSGVYFVVFHIYLVYQDEHLVAAS